MCRGGSASKDLRAGDGKRTPGCVNVPVFARCSRCLEHTAGRPRLPPSGVRSGASRTGASDPTRAPGASGEAGDGSGLCKTSGVSEQMPTPHLRGEEKVAGPLGFGVRSTGVKRARVGPEDRAADRGRPVTAGAGASALGALESRPPFLRELERFAL